MKHVAGFWITGVDGYGESVVQLTEKINKWLDKNRNYVSNVNVSYSIDRVGMSNMYNVSALVYYED